MVKSMEEEAQPAERLLPCVVSASRLRSLDFLLVSFTWKSFHCKHMLNETKPSQWPPTYEFWRKNGNFVCKSMQQNSCNDCAANQVGCCGCR